MKPRLGSRFVVALWAIVCSELFGWLWPSVGGGSGYSCSCFVQAQERPTLFANKFDYSQSFRTNVCERQRLLWNNSIELPSALNGLNLTVVITNYEAKDEVNYFTLDANGRIPFENCGLYCVIMDEVARRAGFSWRNSFAAVGPRNTTTDGNKTWTDILEWGVHTFDISMEKWGRSIGRLEKGISFPTGWWDSSVLLVESLPESAFKREFNLWSFLDPFQGKVWLAIIACIIFTGALHWILESLNPNSDERDLEEKPWASVFYAALTVTGHFEFKPNTHPSRILGLSWTFWTLIVGSAYTANLASFLVSPQVNVFRISTIEDALKHNAVICVQKNAVIQTILSNRYPDLNMIPKETETEIYSSLRLPIERGGCHAAAHQFNTYAIYQRSLDVNYDCSLDSEKRVVEVVPAGMATIVDTGGGPNAKCTSLISHVLDYHLTEMIADGFIEKAWRNHLNRIGTIECIRAPPKGGDGGEFEDTFSLGLRDVGGIFILHAILTTLAMSLALFQFYHMNPDRHKKSLRHIMGLEICEYSTDDFRKSVATRRARPSMTEFMNVSDSHSFLLRPIPDEEEESPLSEEMRSGTAETQPDAADQAPLPPCVDNISDTGSEEIIFGQPQSTSFDEKDGKDLFDGNHQVDPSLWESHLSEKSDHEKNTGDQDVLFGDSATNEMDTSLNEPSGVESMSESSVGRKSSFLDNVAAMPSEELLSNPRASDLIIKDEESPSSLNSNVEVP